MSNHITHSSMIPAMVAGALLRSETKDDFELHVEANFKLVDEMINFLLIKKPEMVPSEMILIGEITMAQMVANYWPDLKIKLDQMAGDDKIMMSFMSTMQNIINTMLVFYLKEGKPPALMEEVPITDGKYTIKECADAIVQKFTEIHEMLAQCKGS